MYLMPRHAVLFLWRIFGIFPVVFQTTPSGRTTMTYSPNVGLWGMCLVCVLASCSIFAVVFDIFETSKGRPIKILSNINVVPLLLNHISLSAMAIVTVIGCSSNVNKLIDVYNTLRILDTKLGVRLYHPNATLLWVSLGSLTLAVTTFITFTILVTQFATYYVYIPHVFLYYFRCANGFHFYHLCNHFYQRFRIINESIIKFASKSNGELSRAKIQDLLDDYWLLTDCVHQSDVIYGSQLLVTLLSIIIHILIPIYNFSQYFAQPFEQQAIPYIAIQSIWLVAHVSQLFLFVWPATEVTKVAKESATTVCKLMNEELDSHIKQQMKRFLIQLLHQKAGFSGLGFFKVHCDIIPQIANNVITYIVVLLQFRVNQSKGDTA